VADKKETIYAILDLDVGPEAKKGLDRLDAGMKRVSDGAKKAERDLKNMWAGVTGGPAGSGAKPGTFRGVGGSGGGGFAGLGGGKGSAADLQKGGGAGGMFAGIPGAAGLMRFAGPAYLAHLADKSSVNIANSAYSEHMTSSQQGRSFLKEVVPGGEWLANRADAFTGRKSKMDRAEDQKRAREFDIQQRQQESQFMLRYGPEQAGREERSRQASGFGGIMLGPMARNTAAGEREFREQSRLLPVRREMAKAEREAAGAAVERKAAEAEFIKLADREKRLIIERGEAQTKVNRDTGSGPARQEKLLQLESRERELQAVAAEKQVAAEAKMMAMQREASARHAVGQARAGMAEARAANLEERAGTAAATEQRLGGMNVFDRQFGLQSLKDLQQYGVDRLTPEQLQAAQQMAPQTVAKILETHGAGTREAGELSKLAPADYGGRSEGLRQDAQQARDVAESERAQSDAQFYKSAADSGRDMAGIVKEAMRVQFESFKREIEQDRKKALSHQ